MKKFKAEAKISWEFDVWLEAETVKEAQDEICQLIADDIAKGNIPIEEIQDIHTIDDYPPPQVESISLTES